MPSFEAALEDRSFLLERMLADARSFYGGVEGARSVKPPNGTKLPRDTVPPKDKGGGGGGGGGGAPAATAARATAAESVAPAAQPVSASASDTSESSESSSAGE